MAIDAVKRRAKGDHALRWRPDKGLFQMEVMLPRGPGETKRPRRTLYGKTENEVWQKLADLKANGGGTLTPPARTKVADFMAGWLDAAEQRVKPRTIESYRWAWSHARDVIGPVRFDQFTRKTALQLFEALERGGASANTIRHVARVMQTAFEAAIAESVYNGDNGGNPFRMVATKKPRHQVARGRALSVAEAKRFIAAAREDDLEAAWILGLTAGLRIGEMFGLKWADVDLKKRTIFVQRQAQYVVTKTREIDDAGEPVREGKVVVVDLKTADSLRLLPIGQLAVDAMKRRKAAARTENSEWVFPSAKRTTPISPNNARRRNFAETVARAKITGSLTPHDLRHTMNSLGGAAGIGEKVRSERMGHADSTITRRVYTHTIDGQAREAATKIDQILSATTACRR